MIPLANPYCAVGNNNDVHAAFLELLPKIENRARMYFRDIRCPDLRADKINETIALAWKWFGRLVERGKDISGFSMVFIFLAVKAVKCGRRLCGQERANDVMSPRAQRRHDFKLQSMAALTRRSRGKSCGFSGQRDMDILEERLCDNTVTPVPDQAAFRIDFTNWLRALTPRERMIIRAMACNERTKDVSQRFHISDGRVSQLRREFEEGWQRYCGEVEGEKAVAVV